MNTDDIICLEIVKGIPKAPGDTESAEQDLVVLDLIDPNGFSIQTRGWTPAFPGVKRGGTWTESQITDGRTLIAAAKDNVTETIELGVGNTDVKQRYQLLGKLNQLLDDARGKWEGTQTEPVYLKFKAACATVYQYALIYNGSIAQDTDPFESNPWNVTLTVEREMAWRMVVPPGGNPLEYHFYSQGKTRGVDYTYTDLILYDNEDHWGYRELDNACEFNGADKTTFLTYPWIDIDGTDIPGDAPALVCTAFRVGQKQLNQLYMALSTEPRRRYHRALDDYAYTRNTLNAGDVPSLTVDSCGLLTNDQIVNRYIHQETVLAASTTFANSIVWRVGVGTGDPCAPFLLNQMRGEWALFLRCQSTTAGADGDLEARIVISSADSIADRLELPPANVPYQSVGANCREFDLTYMGRITLPLNGQVNASNAGTGYNTYNDGWYITVQVRNVIGANRVFEILDLVFMPVHEGFCQANPDAQTDWPFVVGAGGEEATLIFDNTGYFNHGHTDDFCMFTPDNESIPQSVQLLGSVLTAEPGVDNRFYFLTRLYHSASSQQYCPGTFTRSFGEFQVRMNIVPRCYGIATL